jgi:hypothetical protein
MLRKLVGLRSPAKALGVVGSLALCGLLATDSFAHREPVNCQGSGVNLQLFVFRANGTSDATGQTFTTCETVVYQARLCQAGLSGGIPVCAIQSGELVITTPDGTATDVTPAGGVPLLTFDPITGSDCVLSDTVTYMVDPADATGAPPTVTAIANYNDGIAHTGTTDTMTNAETEIGNELTPCPSDVCQEGVCNPNLSDGTRTGLCELQPAQASTPCGTDTDGNACTSPGCDDMGNCVQDHILATDSTPCGPDTDGNACTSPGCDDQGMCVQDHVIIPESTPCTDNDGNVCTIAGCDVTGACNQSHIVIPDCNPVCTHPCPSTIRFDNRRTPTELLDTLHVRTGYVLGPMAFDPAAEGIKVSIANAGGTIWTGTLLPGDLIKRGSVWIFRDRGASKGMPLRDGIAYLSTSRRGDGVWRFRLHVVDDLSAATTAEMTLTIEAAGKVFSRTSIWTQLSNGWRVDLKIPLG